MFVSYSRAQLKVADHRTALHSEYELATQATIILNCLLITEASSYQLIVTDLMNFPSLLQVLPQQLFEIVTIQYLVVPLFIVYCDLTVY